MRAVVLSAFNQEIDVEDLAIPQPIAGEVRVKVHAASVNGFDLSVSKGYLEGMMEHRFPVVLGKDFAGTVDMVSDGVTGFAFGDRVFGVVSKDYLGDGSFGEYVTVPASMGIAKLPDQVGFIEGAALGLAGTAAVDVVEAADLSAGDTVLVVGATGGVGQQVVQLAVHAGARVIATARGEAGVKAVTALGAVDTLDHTGDIIAQSRRLAPGGFDAVIHLAGGPAEYVSTIKQGGVLVSTMLRGPNDVAAEGLRVAAVYASPTHGTLTRIASAQAEGRTTVNVERTYGLDDVPKAFDDFASGTLGKLVITLE